MSSTTFSEDELTRISEALKADPTKYGLPKREYGSVVLASFNIRKLGYVNRRNGATWDFLAYVCSHFDLLAVQEIMDDLSGFRELNRRMGDRFGAIVSDKTGAFPGEPGLGERLGFIFNWSIVQRGEVASDVSFDRTRLLETLAQNRVQIDAAIAPLEAYLKGSGGRRPKVKLPVFLTFARQPFCVSFRVQGHPGTKPYEFMAVNAHLIYGEMRDRRQEFDALMGWIMARVKEEGKAYYPNFILLGDLNLDFDNPRTDRDRIEIHIKTFNQEMNPVGANVNFPFLDIHPDQKDYFRTNARQNQTFDQIGLFSQDERLPTYKENEIMGQDPCGPDYGVFNFPELFSQALHKKPFSKLTKAEQKSLYGKFEHRISDHLPLWLRLPLP